MTYRTEAVAVPDWSETPLRKKKGLKDIAIKRGELSVQKKEIEAEIGKLNNALYAALQSADVRAVRADQFTVSLVTREATSKLDEGELKRLLVEDGMSIEKVQKYWKTASILGKPSSYVMVKGGSDGGE